MARAKVSDELCARYLKLKKEIKKREEEAEEIRQVCLDNGACQTPSFVVAVWNEERETFSMDDVLKHFNLSKEDIRDAELMKISSYQKMKITPKEA